MHLISAVVHVETQRHFPPQFLARSPTKYFFYLKIVKKSVESRFLDFNFIKKLFLLQVFQGLSIIREFKTQRPSANSYHYCIIATLSIPVAVKSQVQSAKFLKFKYYKLIIYIHA